MEPKVKVHPGEFLVKSEVLAQWLRGLADLVAAGEGLTPVSYWTERDAPCRAWGVVMQVWLYDGILRGLDGEAKKVLLAGPGG